MTRVKCFRREKNSKNDKGKKKSRKTKNLRHNNDGHENDIILLRLRVRESNTAETMRELTFYCYVDFFSPPRVNII